MGPSLHTEFTRRTIENWQTRTASWVSCRNRKPGGEICESNASAGRFGHPLGIIGRDHTTATPASVAEALTIEFGLLRREAEY